MQKLISVKGYAKINPTLDVVKIIDNWRVVRLLTWHKINLFDVVHIKIASGQKGDISISCDNEAVPQGVGNLFAGDSSAQRNNCWKAAKVMFEQLSKRGRPNNYSVKIHIEKRIPLIGGLGGSASDSAAVMIGLNELFGLAMTEDELSVLGAQKVGHDVSFLVRKGALYVGDENGTKGIALANPQKIYFVRLTPNVSVTAKDAYEGLLAIKEQFKGDSSYSTDEFIRILQSAESFPKKSRQLKAKLIAIFRNELELSENTLAAHPQIKNLKAEIESYDDIIKAMMSGSGPTILGFVENEKTAKRLANELSEAYPNLQVGWNYTLDYDADFITNAH